MLYAEGAAYVLPHKMDEYLQVIKAHLLPSLVLNRQEVLGLWHAAGVLGRSDELLVFYSYEGPQRLDLIYNRERQGELVNPHAQEYRKYANACRPDWYHTLLWPTAATPPHAEVQRRCQASRGRFIKEKVVVAPGKTRAYLDKLRSLLPAAARENGLEFVGAFEACLRARELSLYWRVTDWDAFARSLKAPLSREALAGSSWQALDIEFDLRREGKLLVPVRL